MLFPVPFVLVVAATAEICFEQAEFKNVLSFKPFLLFICCILQPFSEDYIGFYAPLECFHSIHSPATPNIKALKNYLLVIIMTLSCFLDHNYLIELIFQN